MSSASTASNGSSVRGRLALVGSGEYTPAMQDVEGWLLDGRPRVAAVLDVDRVRFPASGADAAAAANASRLLRSLTGERLGLGREPSEGQLSAIRATGDRAA